MERFLERDADERINWVESIPFILMHLAPLGILWSGFTWRDVLLCIGLYWLRMFFITAGYHRYFSHRSYKTSRVMQFILAFGGGTSVQKGALWWAAHHRHHHKHSDEDVDIHSPRKGFWWSHVGWIVCPKYNATRYDLIKDLAKYPELRWLNTYHWVPPIIMGTSVYLLFGWSGFFAGFMLSTVLLYHGTFVINSLTHMWGTRRYVTSDTSKNSLILALITMGEGWHNNHHYYQRSTNQGFFWWEIDMSFYILKVLSWMRIVWDIHTPPKKVIESNLIADGHTDIGMIEPHREPAIAIDG